VVHRTTQVLFGLPQDLAGMVPFWVHPSICQDAENREVPMTAQYYREGCALVVLAGIVILLFVAWRVLAGV